MNEFLLKRIYCKPVFLLFSSISIKVYILRLFMIGEYNSVLHLKGHVSHAMHSGLRIRDAPAIRELQEAWEKSELRIPRIQSGLIDRKTPISGYA